MQPTTARSGVALDPEAIQHVPADYDDFVGRDEALAALARWASEAEGPMTIVGPPGVGKSRLARHFLTQVHPAASAVYVPLASLDEPNHLLVRIARSLGLAPHDHEAARAAISAHLAGLGQKVIYLDNAEHLRDAVARVVDELGGLGPVEVLTTSRRPLGCDDEQVLHLDGLDSVTAADLFVERASRIQPDLAALLEDTDKAPAAIARLVRLVEGHPLALELSASRVHLYGPAALSDALEDSLEVLAASGTPATSDPPLRAALASSWELLEPQARTAWAWLSLFRDPFELSDARQLLADRLGAASVDTAVEALLAHSLVRSRTDPKLMTSVLSMYEVVRQHGRACLEDTGERDEAQARLVEMLRGRFEQASQAAGTPEAAETRRHALRLVDTARTLLAGDSPPPGALGMLTALCELLRRQRMNLVEDILERSDRLLEAADEADGVLRARFFLQRAQFNSRRGHPHRVAPDLERIDADELADHPQLLAELERLWAFVDVVTGEHDSALEHARAAVETAERADQSPIVLRCLKVLGNVLTRMQRPDEALEVFRRADEVALATQDPRLVGEYAATLGVFLASQQRVDEALARLTAARDALEDASDTWNLAFAMDGLAVLRLDQADADAALEAIERAIEAYRRSGAMGSLARARVVRAFAHLAKGQLDIGEQDLRRAVAEPSSAEATAEAFGRIGLGLIAWQRGHRGEAGREFDRAHSAALDNGQATEARQAELLSAMTDEATDPIPAPLPTCASSLLEVLHCQLGALGQLREARRQLEAGHVDKAHSARQRADKLRQIVADSDFGPDRAVLARQVDQRLEDETQLLEERMERANQFVVGPDCHWVETGGTRLELDKRTHYRRIVAFLLDIHRESCGDSVSVYDLLDAGWPDQEGIDPEAGAARVYTAIRWLRKNGLKGVLLTRDGGYMLDPDLQVVESS